MSFLQNLGWRYAVKHFDPDERVSDEQVEWIKESIRMTPTSFGLEPYKVLTITDQAVKELLLPHSWNQPQVTTCSHLLVFCANTDVESHIEQYLEMASAGDTEKRKDFAGYEQMMRGFLAKKNDAEVLVWAQKQVYIALGFAMAACAELHVDSCPMEGFDAKKYAEILKTPAHIVPTVLLPLGYRTEDPQRDKIRFPEEELFG